MSFYIKCKIMILSNALFRISKHSQPLNYCTLKKKKHSQHPHCHFQFSLYSSNILTVIKFDMHKINRIHFIQCNITLLCNLHRSKLKWCCNISARVNRETNNYLYIYQPLQALTREHK